MHLKMGRNVLTGSPAQLVRRMFESRSWGEKAEERRRKEAGKPLVHSSVSRKLLPALRIGCASPSSSRMTHRASLHSA